MCQVLEAVEAERGAAARGPEPRPCRVDRVRGAVCQSSDYYAKGRYVEAALEFEGLWRDFPGEPRFLFNAAVCRAELNAGPDGTAHRASRGERRL